MSEGRRAEVVMEEEKLRRLLQLAGPLEPVEEDRAARVRRAIRGEWKQSYGVEKNSATPWRWAAAAALVLAAIGAAWPWLQPKPAVTLGYTSGDVAILSGRSQTPAVRRMELKRGDRVVTGVDGQAVLEWSSGNHPSTSLRIDAGSEFAISAAAIARLERGRLYLDSPEGAAALRLETPLGTVVDIGTQYEVAVGPAQFQVRVREGKVRVERGSSREEAGAGTELSWPRDGEPRWQSLTAYGPSWDWAIDLAPPFSQENPSLAEIVDWVARETGRSVVYADPAIRERAARVTLRGGFGETRPDELLDLVFPTTALIHEATRERIWVGEGSQRSDDGSH